MNKRGEKDDETSKIVHKGLHNSMYLPENIKKIYELISGLLN